MYKPFASIVVASLALCAYAGASAAAETWSADQQELWKLEQQQWKMAAAKDSSWIASMVHPNLHYWDTGSPMPRDKASLQHWNRYDSESSTVLEQELMPLSVTITGDVAVVQYYYMAARENYKKERETVTGHYTDVLVKQGGHWMFLAWAGGDDPKK
jgi:hypothetical protein